MQESVIYQDILEEGLREGRQQGLQQEAMSFVLRLLNRRFANLPTNLMTQVQSLSVEQLEALGEAILDFETQNDLEQWLAEQEG
jgi:predicted transposase YdaD